MTEDLHFGQELASKFPVTVIDRQASAAELMGFFSKMELLISCRLHSAILGMRAGTPVVTIEQQIYKIGAIIESLGYPYATVNSRKDGWAKQVIANVISISSRRKEVVDAGHIALRNQVETIRNVYKPLFALASSVSGASFDK